MRYEIYMCVCVCVCVCVNAVRRQRVKLFLPVIFNDSMFYKLPRQSAA